MNEIIIKFFLQFFNSKFGYHIMIKDQCYLAD